MLSFFHCMFFTSLSKINVHRCIYFWVFNTIPLIDLSVSVSIPFVPKPEVTEPPGSRDKGTSARPVASDPSGLSLCYEQFLGPGYTPSSITPRRSSTPRCCNMPRITGSKDHRGRSTPRSSDTPRSTEALTHSGSQMTPQHISQYPA